MIEVTILQDKKFGYVRVSSKDQNEERQIENMKYLGIEDRDIFIDKQSGKNMKRENYQMLKRLARTGDTIIFDSLRLSDRVAALVRRTFSINSKTGCS
ncbi:recombinase family protein [Bacillus sp. FSL K6-2944]|uniref:recombinase family protein n=1 Tax=Bacillus sp. FSL K6-2944 TaxID=2921486 RepID=UPI0030FB9715